MRRRSLFAGLAGLLAAPKVAAAVPKPAIYGHPGEFLLVAGKAEEITRGGFISGDEWASGAWSYDSGEVILPLSRGGPYDWKLPDGVAVHELRIGGAGGGGGQSSSGSVDLTPGEEVVIQVTAPPTPIGVTWSGYADEVSARPAPSEAAALAGGGEDTSDLPPPAALPSGSFHAGHRAAGAATPAIESSKGA